MSEDTPKPMTNAERQRAFRARKAAQTATEVRGVFAHPDDHQAVKDYAAKLARKRAKAVGAYVMTRRSKLLEPTDIPQGLIEAKREQLRILLELRKEDHEER